MRKIQASSQKILLCLLLAACPAAEQSETQQSPPPQAGSQAVVQVSEAELNAQAKALRQSLRSLQPLASQFQQPTAYAQQVFAHQQAFDSFKVQPQAQAHPLAESLLLATLIHLDIASLLGCRDLPEQAEAEVKGRCEETFKALAKTYEIPLGQLQRSELSSLAALLQIHLDKVSVPLQP
jgi:hypothetical protein